jgi:hypothetical protein
MQIGTNSFALVAVVIDQPDKSPYDDLTLKVLFFLHEWNAYWLKQLETVDNSSSNQ